MDLLSLQSYFSTAPAIQLLRARSAPYLLCFLHREFKASQQLTVPASKLSANLREFQEELRDLGDEALPDTPTHYLTAWCQSETRYLHRFFEANRDEPSFQLTPHTEEVLQFLDRVLSREQGHVGTESRVRLIIDTLRDLAIHGNEDAEARIAHLRAEQARIESEITEIEESGAARVYQSVQIRERFATVISLLKELLGDFRHVEEAFKKITRDVQQRQLASDVTRGGVLEFALDAEDLIKKEDQGVSFEAFARLILSPRERRDLDKLIEEVVSMEELRAQSEGVDALRGTPAQLLAEARKVMETNQRLSASLRRLLDSEASGDRRRMRQLLREVKEAAARRSDNSPGDDFVFELDDRIVWQSPMSRELWTPPPVVDTVEARISEVDPAARDSAFRALAEMARLDWKGMRQCITEATREGQPISLGHLLETFPPSAGSVEVLGYLQIARDDGHLVSDSEEEIVRLPGDEGVDRALRLPKVVFSPK